jgi:hypothetical protein
LKKIKVTLVALIVVLLVMPLPSVGLARPGFTPTIQSPSESSTINTNSLTVRFSVATGPDSNLASIAVVDSMQVSVYLDSTLRNSTLFSVKQNNQLLSDGEFTLTGLNPGAHTIEIKVHATILSIFGGPYEEDLNPAIAHFYVAYPEIPSKAAPNVTIAGMDEYWTNQVAVNITTDDVASIVSYSLDGGTNVTLPFQNCYQYNVTLTSISEGAHNITAYAKDNLGQTVMTEKTFTVSNIASQPVQFFSPVAIIAGAVAAGVVVALVVVLFFNRKTEPKEKGEVKSEKEKSITSKDENKPPLEQQVEKTVDSKHADDTENRQK